MLQLSTEERPYGAGKPGGTPRGPLELWVAEADTGAARKLVGGLNTVLDECACLHISSEIITLVVVLSLLKLLQY